MRNVEEVINKALNYIVPTKKERNLMESFIKNLESVVKDVINKYSLSYTLAGSFIRDTWLSDKKEVDVFILFPEKTSRNELEKMGIKVGKIITRKMNGNFVIEYAEHPYVRARINDFFVDIVPCYKLKNIENMKSAVDRTPFHNNFIKKNLKKKHSNQVRILKCFLKNNNLYGSDIKTCGFSGYLTELLIIKYGSFLNLVKNASKWTAPVFIDLMNKINEKQAKKIFKGQPLIFIDPVDKRRNVAAVLSCRNFIHFVMLCKKFIEKPSINFFIKKEKLMEKEWFEKCIKERGTKLIGIVFNRPKVVDDILYSQMRKFEKRILTLSKDCGFRILRTDSFSNKNECIVVFEFEVYKLPNIEIFKGPPIFSGKHIKEFIEKYKDKRIDVNDCLLTVEKERKFKTAKKMLICFLSKGEDELKLNGLPSYIAESISKKFKLIGEKILVEKTRDRNFNKFLTKFLTSRINI